MELDLLIVGVICSVLWALIGYLIGRDVGRKSLLPLIDEVNRLQDLEHTPPETPQYTNYPGTSGIFLGRFRSTIGKGLDYDLYFGAQPPQVVFARYGDEGEEFTMTDVRDEVAGIHEATAEAIRRVRNGGLL